MIFKSKTSHTFYLLSSSLHACATPPVESKKNFEYKKRYIDHKKLFDIFIKFNLAG